MMGQASASVFAMIGSSMSWGRRPRTRETLSRTSAAAASGSRDSLKMMVMLLVSDLELDDMTSTPSMPEIESSRTLVTWLSITSAEAPRYTVSTLTTGSSVLGYSRTAMRVYEIAPISSTA